MMFHAELVRLLHLKPFVPFRLHVSEGVVYDVRHPDLVIATLGFVAIGYPDPENPGMALAVDIVNMNHVIRIEPISSPSAPASASTN